MIHFFLCPEKCRAVNLKKAYKMNGMRRSTGQSLRWSISWFRLVQQDKDIHQSFEVSYYTVIPPLDVIIGTVTGLNLYMMTLGTILWILLDNFCGYYRRHIPTATVIRHSYLILVHL